MSKTRGCLRGVIMAPEVSTPRETAWFLDTVRRSKLSLQRLHTCLHGSLGFIVAETKVSMPFDKFASCSLQRTNYTKIMSIWKKKNRWKKYTSEWYQRFFLSVSSEGLCANVRECMSYGREHLIRAWPGLPYVERSRVCPGSPCRRLKSLSRRVVTGNYRCVGRT